MGNNSAHAVVLPTQLCFSLRSSPPAQRLFTSVSFVSHPWSIQGGRHARLSCHFHEPSLTVFSLPTYFSWCRRLRAVGVVEELRLAPVALERVHDVPLGLRDLPQFRNEGACVPPYYRASPLHGGRVQGDLLKTRAKACTSEDLQLNAGGCLGRVLKHNVAVGDSSTAGANPPSPPLKAHLGRLTPRCREEAQSPQQRCST